MTRANISAADTVSADEFAELLRDLELSPRGAARVVGVHERTCFRWLSGERDVPVPAYRMLVLMRDFDIAPGAVVKHFASIENEG